MPKLTLRSEYCEVKAAVFKTPTCHYVLCNGMSAREVSDLPELEWLKTAKIPWTAVNIPKDADMNGEDNYFVCYLEDCFSPPMYLINAQDESDDYEIFADVCEHLCVIAEEDADDYDLDECHLNSNGNWCNLEALHIVPVKPYLFLFK